jgi:hypothetical protein
LSFNGIKFEIKTSSIDVNKKFQNEGIKENGDYGAILFLGITPNQLYIKFILKSEIDFGKLHNRGKRETGKGYKWDFKIKDMMEISNLKDIQNEFERKFGKFIKK